MLVFSSFANATSYATEDPALSAYSIVIFVPSKDQTLTTGTRISSLKEISPRSKKA